MNEIFIYIIKVNLIISLCFLFYWLLLRKENFFTLNRFILLGAIVIGFVLPMLPGTALPGLQQKWVAPLQESFTIGKQSNPGQLLVENEHQSNEPQTQMIPSPHLVKKAAFPNISLIKFVAFIYILIAGILFTRFILQLLQVCILLKGNETRSINGIVYHSTKKPLPPFSFFHHLVINKNHKGKELEQIIAHEKVHIKQWHTVDILLINLVQVVFWCNPIIWMMNRMIKLNLEYIADEAVLKSGINKKSYQSNILINCLNPVDYKLVNLFTSSKIKLRIKMMNANRSPLSHLYKYALILPLLLLTYFLMNPASATATNNNQFPAWLQSIKASFKTVVDPAKAVDVNVNEEKYKIISIKTTNKRTVITLKDENGKTYRLTKVNNRIKDLFIDDVRIPEEKMASYQSFFNEVDHLQKNYKEAIEKKLTVANTRNKEIEARSKQTSEQESNLDGVGKIPGTYSVNNIDGKQLDKITGKKKSIENIEKDAGKEKTTVSDQQEKHAVQEALISAEKTSDVLMQQANDKRGEARASTGQSLKQIKQNLDRTQQTIAAIITELKKENIIRNGKKLHFILSDEQLVVNGKIQPGEIHSRLKTYLENGKAITYSRSGL